MAKRASGAGLEGRTLRVGDRARHLRMEPSYWEALSEIAEREGRPIEEICSALLTRIEREARRVSSANAVRVFIVDYFRRAATERGHGLAGHGLGDPFAQTPFDEPASRTLN